MSIPRRQPIPHGPYALCVRPYASARKDQNEFVRLRTGMLRAAGHPAWEWSSQHDLFRYRTKAEAESAFMRVRQWAHRHVGYVRDIELAWAPAKICPSIMARGPARKFMMASRIRRKVAA